MMRKYFGFALKLELNTLRENEPKPKRKVFSMFIRRDIVSTVICSLMCVFLCAMGSSCGSEFPPGGKPINVTKTTNGVTLKMTIGKKSYSGIVECDPETKAKEICERLSDYKVLVYVETDKLYIHPYLGSHSGIDQDGSWRVSKVDRDPPPSAVYAFLIGKDDQVPDELFSKSELDYVASVEWFRK